jgi:iron complex transport system permease protein
MAGAAASDRAGRLLRARGPAWGRSRYQRRFPVVVLVTTAMIVVLVCLHTALGTIYVSPLRVLGVLAGSPASPLDQLIVWNLRLPVALLAVASGAMLGMSGAILQSVTHNPLASPQLTGLTGGCVVAVAFWVTFVPVSEQAVVPIPIVAFAGGLGTGLLVYLLAATRSGTDPARLALVGILTASVTASVTSFALIWNGDHLGTILKYLIGSLDGATWSLWGLIWPWAAVTLTAGFLCAGPANALNLGDRVAGGLGQHVERTRLCLMLTAGLLTAVAVSAVGAVAFIGLIGPHISRRLVGDDARRLFPTSALVSAAVMVAADLLASTVALHVKLSDIPQQANLPVGAVTSLLGAAFFFSLLSRSRT